MRDLPIASDLSYFVFEQRRRESHGLALQSYQAHQVTSTVSDTRIRELLARLGGQSPVVREDVEGSVHER